METISSKLKINLLSDTNVKRSINTEFSPTFEAIYKDAETFFIQLDDTEKEITIQWRSTTLRKLQDFSNNLIDQTCQKINELVQHKKGREKLDKGNSLREQTLLEKSKKLALELRGKGLCEDKLRSEFDKMWNLWASELANDIPPPKEVNVNQETENILYEKFNNQNLFKRLEAKMYERIAFQTNFKEYVTVTQKLTNRRCNSYGPDISLEEANQIMIDHTRRLTETIEQFVDHTRRLTETIEQFVKEKVILKVDFGPNFILDIIRKVEIMTKDLDQPEKRFQVHKEYMIDMCLFLCTRAAKYFQVMHETFQAINNPLTYLESKKKSCYATFEGFCKGAMTTALLADLIGNELRDAIRLSVQIKATEELSTEIRSNIDAFRGNRSNLENHILEALAENENFEDLMLYICTPKSYIENFIAKKIKKYCCKKREHIEKNIFKNIVTSFCKIVLAAVDLASSSNEFKSKFDVKDWLDLFCDEMQSQDLVMIRKDLCSVEYQEINDMDFLKNAIAEVVSDIEKSLIREFCDLPSKNSVSSTTSQTFLGRITLFFKPTFTQEDDEFCKSLLEKFDLEKIQEKILNNLCGCWVQCPFCKSLCTNTLADHDGDHSVEFHRPQGLNEWYWNKTKNLMIENCSTSVGSNCCIVYDDDDETLPWKEYRKYKNNPDAAFWSITPDTSLQPYWKWIICRFQSEIEDKYGKKFAG